MKRKNKSPRVPRGRALLVFAGGTLAAKSIVQLVKSVGSPARQKLLQVFGDLTVLKDYEPTSPYAFSHTPGDTPTAVIWPAERIEDAYHDVMRALTPGQLKMNITSVCVLVSNPDTPNFKHMKTQLERLHQFNIDWGGDKPPRVKIVEMPKPVRVDNAADSLPVYEKAVVRLQTRLIRALGAGSKPARPRRGAARSRAPQAA